MCPAVCPCQLPMQLWKHRGERRKEWDGQISCYNGKHTEHISFICFLPASSAYLLFKLQKISAQNDLRFLPLVVSPLTGSHCGSDLPKSRRHFQHKHTFHPSLIPWLWQSQSAGGQKPQRCWLASHHHCFEKLTEAAAFWFPKAYFYYFFICCSSDAIYSIQFLILLPSHVCLKLDFHSKT